MEWETSKKMKVSALSTFSLLLFTLSAFADIKIVAPKSGEEVSLLKDAQSVFLTLPNAMMGSQMTDAKARAEFAQCGGRPERVTLEWSDSNFDTNVVYTIVLRCETGTTERFEVKGAQKAALVNLESGRKYAWKVSVASKASSGAAAAFRTAPGPRLMMIPGVANCRDLGGWVGVGGKRMRQGRVYRTAAYNGSSKRAGDSFLDAKFVPGAMRITKSGQREMVEKCGVRTDLDLRNQAECAGMTASPLGEQVAWVNVPMRAYGWLENDKEAVGKALKIFADEKNYPIAFHCSGGRDRAGSLAFVLEGLCGVSRDDLERDWALSIFDTDDLAFAPARLDGLYDLLKRYPGDTIGARVEGFARACGLTDDDIAKIRVNLLEK